MDSNNKYKFWMVTIFRHDVEEFRKEVPSSTDLGTTFEAICNDFVFQEEKCPSTDRRHWQCCLKTKIRKRQQTLLNDLTTLLNIDKKYIQVDRMQGDWEQAVLYCSKEDSRIGTTYRFNSGSIPYSGNDINFLSERENRHSWQNFLFDEIFESDARSIKDPDDRTIYWITDNKGNSGKSKFVKYCCFTNNSCAKVSFGSASQLRSGLISTGQKSIYFIDIPRTLGNDDSINNILSAIEDLKNGFLTSNFYGNSTSLLMDPPHIIVFSNMDCPTEKLSSDRWRELCIINYEMRELTEFGFKVL